MRLVAQNIHAADEWIPPFAGEIYVAFVLLMESSELLSEFDSLSNKLVNTKCRYVCSWGEQCELFHDLVDESDVMLSLDKKNDAPSIMTTWHNNESIEDALFYFFNCSFDDLRFRNFAILVVGSGSWSEENLSTLVDTYVRSAAHIWEFMSVQQRAELHRRILAQEAHYDENK